MKTYYLITYTVDSNPIPHNKVIDKHPADWLAESHERGRENPFDEPLIVLTHSMEITQGQYERFKDVNR